MICHLISPLSFRASCPPARFGVAIPLLYPSPLILHTQAWPPARHCGHQHHQRQLTRSRRVVRSRGRFDVDLTPSPEVFGSVGHSLPKIVSAILSLLLWARGPLLFLIHHVHILQGLPAGTHLAFSSARWHPGAPLVAMSCLLWEKRGKAGFNLCKGCFVCRRCLPGIL